MGVNEETREQKTWADDAEGVERDNRLDLAVYIRVSWIIMYT